MISSSSEGRAEAHDHFQIDVGETSVKLFSTAVVEYFGEKTQQRSVWLSLRRFMDGDDSTMMRRAR